MEDFVKALKVQEWQTKLVTQYDNMIWKYVRSFNTTTGIDPEELYSAVVEECCRALRSYDPERSSLSTFLFTTIRRRLCTIVQKIQNQEKCEAGYPTDDDIFTNIKDNAQDPARLAEIRIMGGELSEDAKLLFSKVRAKPYLYIGGVDSLKTKLRRRGWSNEKIDTVIQEIREMLL